MSNELRYSVEFSLPAATFESRDRLVTTMHRIDRHVGIPNGNRDGRFWLSVMTRETDADAARRSARALVRTALNDLDLSALWDDVEVGETRGHQIHPGGPRPVNVVPPLNLRTAVLPDGRSLVAGCEGPLGEWFVWFADTPDEVTAGRGLGGILWEILDLPRARWPQWMHDALATLAGHATPNGIRFACPCCENLTLAECPPGSFSICPVCFWEDDGLQFGDPDYRGGANKVSLREARATFEEIGASEPRVLQHVRPPRPDEHPS